MMKRNAIVFAAVILLVTSCYKMVSSYAPEEVEAGQTFMVSFTVIDDGDEFQKFAKDWSFAGIRVPEGWTVTVPEGCHEQFAEDWVYYEDGTQAHSRQNMVSCAKLSEIYNEICPKPGYRWSAFSSESRLSKYIAACWRNGCDSVRVTFMVTVPDGTIPGEYTIDFIGGDDEGESGIDGFRTAAETKGKRIFHVGTVNSEYVDNQNLSLSRKVRVTEPTAVESIRNDQKNRGAVYDMEGHLVGKTSDVRGLKAGIYYVNGRKTLVNK